MNKVVAFIRPVKSRIWLTFNGIIFQKKSQAGQISMKPVPRNIAELDEATQIILRDRLRQVEQWNAPPGRKLQRCTDFGRLMTEADRQLNQLFSPKWVVFVRNLGHKSVLLDSFGRKINEKALSLKKETSPVLFAQERNLSVYVPQIKKPQVILSDKNHMLSESTYKECNIKLNRELVKAAKSFLIMPLYFSPTSKKALGSIILGWTNESPLEPILDLEPAREIADYFAIPFQSIGSEEALRDMPPLS